MTIKLLNNLYFSISEEDSAYLNKESKEFLGKLKETIRKSRVKAEPFIGGSFAKNTMIQSDNYDVDVFIRFDKKYKEDELSALLGKIAKKIGLKFNKLHGSRDYIQIEKSKKLTFEIIPVIKIKNPKEARNTTDLSYFHVNYVRKKLKNKKLIREIGLAKKFFKANRVYGAESYISGFSGYAIECLIIYYKSFEKMINSFLAEGKIIIDSEKKYKKENILLEINESKTHSPIVFVDPTFKERNVLAALSQETFDKLKGKIKLFIKKPSLAYFEVKPIDEIELAKNARKENAEFVKIFISTERQAGDIAGTKLKKFSRYLMDEIAEYFNIIKDEFDYKLTNNANLYLIVKSKEEILKRGPPIRKEMQKHVDAFKKQNKDYFVKDNILYTKIPVNFTAKQFVLDFARNNKTKLKEMDISSIKS